MAITGLHHVTLVTADAQRNEEFYTRVLGLHPFGASDHLERSVRHLRYADRTGTPGTFVTFVEQPQASRGHPGIGGTHHVAFRTADREALLRWKRRLMDAGVRVRGPYDRHYFTSIYLRDPDGAILEIATDGPGLHIDEPDGVPGRALQRPPSALVRGARDEGAIAMEGWPEAVPVIDEPMSLTRGIHHISATASDLARTDAFLQGLLGLSLVKRTGNFDDPTMPHWTWGSADARPGSLITYFGLDTPSARRAAPGAGQTDHYAFAVSNHDALEQLGERLRSAGVPVSRLAAHDDVLALYTRDPDGHRVELTLASPAGPIDDATLVDGRVLAEATA
jgi:glyoxalase family protein